MVAPADEQIEIEIITRSAAVNHADCHRFTLKFGKGDSLLQVRGDIIAYCHSACDITADKLMNTKLKMLDANGQSAVLNPIVHAYMPLGHFMSEKNFIAPLKIVMPLNDEMGGGGTRQLRTLYYFILLYF